MTEQYAPYQNAIAERINGIMKQEFLMNKKDLDIKTMGKIIKESVKFTTQKDHIFRVTYLHRMKCTCKM